MSQTSLQLLLHAGEIEYIVKNIRKSENAGNEFVGGCLFGLWRNSLKQPVIQFVTGPGQDFKSSWNSLEKLFNGNNSFVKECADYVKESHSLLHLGFWFSGGRDLQDKAQQIVLGRGSPFNVLLVVNLSKERNVEKLTGQYFLKLNYLEDMSLLFNEDVLEGHSSFRKFKPLTGDIKKAKSYISPVLDNDEVGQSTLDLVKTLPSRVQVEEAVTREEQWYSTDDGMQMLQLLFQYFKEAGVTPEMSRDTSTQDMQFGLGGGYTLDFPANFPKRMPELCLPNGGRLRMKHDSTNRDVCRIVVHTVTDFFRDERHSSSHGGGRGDGYGGGKR